MVDNARYMCIGCHSVNYCTKTCQQADWNFHKPQCGRHQLPWLDVVIVPYSDPPRLQGMLANDLSTTPDQWHDCKLPAMFGIPLKVNHILDASTPHVKVVRSFAHHMSIYFMCDPVTGLAPRQWHDVKSGIFIFARIDLVNMTVKLWWDMYSYIYHLMDYYTFESFVYKTFKADKLNKQAFEDYQRHEHEIAMNHRLSILNFKDDEI
jgi:hypothetical protein